MKKYKQIGFLMLTLLTCVCITACDSDGDEPSDKEHDATLYGEWIENDGNTYVHGYLCFHRDGTGITGTWESDIDWVNEDDDLVWYTVGGKYLYMNGAKYEYSCDGTRLETVSSSGRRRTYRER